MNKEPIIGGSVDQHKMGGPFIDPTLGKCDGEGSYKTTIRTFEELEKYFRKINEDINKSSQKQDSIEERIADFAFDQSPGGRCKMAQTLHMFFSPYMIPEGLTVGQARLLYIIALHYNARLAGQTLPRSWLPFVDDGLMNDERFFKGLQEFMKEILGTNGFLPKEYGLARVMVEAGVSKVTPEGTVQVANFFGV